MCMCTCMCYIWEPLKKKVYRATSPPFLIWLGQNKHSFRLAGTPDTGSSINNISFRVAKRENLKIDKNTSISLSTSTVQHMDISGTTKLNAKENGIVYNITAIVSKDLQEDIIISCNDLKPLKVISRGFPTEVCNATEARRCLRTTYVESAKK